MDQAALVGLRGTGHAALVVGRGPPAAPVAVVEEDLAELVVLPLGHARGGVDDAPLQELAARRLG